MHDIWNPWHGCTKISEGCQSCYMYFLDRKRGRDGSLIYKTKTGFTYPLQKDRKGNFKIRSGELIRICMSSDFFLEEADQWRDGAWEIIKRRSDVIFYILTKRPQRVEKCLPTGWGDGWDNVFFNVTCENQTRADERIPWLLDLPFRHKGIMTAPLIGEIHIEKYLKQGQIEQVIAGGENYDGARPCDYDWVKNLGSECAKHNITFCFIETGTYFRKDGKVYKMPKKSVQSEMAFKSGLSYQGKKIEYVLKNINGRHIDEKDLYKPCYKPHCFSCGSRPICNGCSGCGLCGK